MSVPVCPGCGQEAAIVMAGGEQCFCETEDCEMIMWDSTKPLLESSWERMTFDENGLPSSSEPVDAATAIRRLFGVKEPETGAEGL